MSTSQQKKQTHNLGRLKYYEKGSRISRQERDLKRLSSRTEHDIKTNVFDF